LFKGIAQAESSVKVSYVIAETNTKCGKPFVVGEFAQVCHQCAVDITCSAQKQAV
jgi:hypothetical protein